MCNLMIGLFPDTQNGKEEFMFLEWINYKNANASM